MYCRSQLTLENVFTGVTSAEPPQSPPACSSHSHTGAWLAAHIAGGGGGGGSATPLEGNGELVCCTYVLPPGGDGGAK